MFFGEQAEGVELVYRPWITSKLFASNIAWIFFLVHDHPLLLITKDWPRIFDK